MLKLMTLLFLIGFCISATADEWGDLQGVYSPAVTSPGDIDITLTVLNTTEITYAEQVLGMDYDQYDDVIIFSSRNDGLLFMADPVTLEEVSSMGVAGGNNYCFSPVCTAEDEFYTNDWVLTFLYHWDGSYWHGLTNPAGTKGRGMDFDGEYIWQAVEADKLYRFVPGGTMETYHISALPFLMSGVCVFPYEDDLGILVTIYHLEDTVSDINFYAYVFDGDTVELLGSVEIPEDAYKSLGLAYNENRESFYWSYIDKAYIPYIVEFNLGFETSLSQSTWGAIKAGIK